ncbi:hypothetical protein JCM10295v2_000206 [Rhodotorula toruloides]
MCEADAARTSSLTIADRETSFRTSSLGGLDSPPTPHPRFDLSMEEEQRLTDEWGLSEVLSNAAESEYLLRTGRGLARFPSTTRSEAGIVGRVDGRGEAEDRSGEADENVEVLETKSMPDLDRPRTVSFADAVLEGLEQRLRHAPPPRALSTRSNDDSSSTGTRIKILERTATQRLRARTQSLGPSQAGMASLPSLSNLSGDGSVGDLSSGRGGIAARDSLFQRPTSVHTTRTRSIDAPDARPSMDGLSVVTSRLSLALPPDSVDPARPPTPSATDALSAPRPSNSLSTYTSRFDPLVIAAHRTELAKDRPRFANPDAGRPPKVVLMPAPLAGREESLSRREWREGSDSASEGEAVEGGREAEREEEDEEEEAEEVPEGLKEPLHPAGALYGRSLMDVIAERKAILKAQQRAYVPGSDGRKSMLEWNDSAAGKDAFERLGPAGRDEENLPLALVPGGQAALAAKKARAAKVQSTMSIFGPDLVYQREIAQMRELEEVERAEREEREKQEEERRVSEEARRRKGKLRKGGKRKKGHEGGTGEAAPRVQEAVEWQPETVVVAEEEPVEFASPAEAPLHIDAPPADPHPSRRTIAPSISVSFGVSQAASTSDWFEEVLAAPSATKDADDALSDGEDGDLHRPRTVSSLALYHRPSSAAAFDTGHNIFLSSDSSSSDAESEDLDELTLPVNPSPSGAHSDTRHLPFPGEPSSNGHETASLAETQDDVPLAVRYSRHAVALPPIESTGLDDLVRLVPQDQRQEGADDVEDEDDAPLGARFSRMMPSTDDGDEIPLALRRVVLAPSAFAAPALQQAFASVRPIGDDGRTIASDNSDDLPLGLKTAATAPFSQYPRVTYPFPLAMPYPAPGAPFPCSTSQFFPQPIVPPFMPVTTSPLPPHPHAQLALAQMQMQAAMQQQAALAGEDSIDRWRRGISG